MIKSHLCKWESACPDRHYAGPHATRRAFIDSAVSCEYKDKQEMVKARSREFHILAPYGHEGRKYYATYVTLFYNYPNTNTGLLLMKTI